jgi:hypothetical protein
MIEEIKADIDFIKQVKEQNLPYNSSLLVANLYGRMKTLTKAGRVEVLNETVLYALARGVITSRHKMNKLVEIASRIKDVIQNANIKFDGGELLVNQQIERVQILFDSIPTEEARAELKFNGFRYSPKNKAWQRKSTPRGIVAAKKFIELYERTYGL